MASEIPKDAALKKLRHRQLRSWIWLLGVVPVLAVAGLLVLAGSPAGNRWLLLRGIDAADMALPHAILEVGDLETDVVRNIVLRDIRLLDAQEAPLVELGSLEIQWKPMALLRGRVHVEQLVLRRPRVGATVDEQGQVDLLLALGLGGEDKEPASEPWEGLPLRVDVDRIRLVEGQASVRVAAEAEAEPTYWLVRELDLALGFAMWGRQLSVERAVLASELGKQLGEAEPAWLPVGLSGDVHLVDVHRGGSVQKLVLDDLRLKAGSAVAGAGGTVSRLGQEPTLDLQLALRDLYPAELSFLTGELGIDGPFELELEAQGVLDALAAQGRVGLPGEAGALRLGVGANFAAEAPLWNLQLAFDRAEPHRFVELISEPVRLDGALHARGEGLVWPDGLVAELGLALEPGLAWGIPFQGLSAKAELVDGLVQLEQLAFASDLGRADIRGSVDPAGPDLHARFDLRDVRLPRLASLGVPGILGVADLRGEARVSVGDGGVEVGASGQLEAAGGGYDGVVRAGSLASPVRFSWGPAGLELSGELQGWDVASFGAVAEGLQGPWRYALAPDGGMEWQAEPLASGLRYGVLELATLRAAVQGGIPAAGDLTLELDFDASGLEAPSSIAPELRAQRAMGQLRMDGPRLELVTQAVDGERPVVRAQLVMDLATGRLDLPELLVAPTPETTWVASEPVRATMSDGALEDLYVQMRSGNALLWAMGGFDPAGPVDLRLMVSDFTLDPLVPVFPILPRGLQGKTRLALQVSGTVDAIDIDGGAEVEGLVVPGGLRALDARLVLNGEGGRLDFQLDLPEPLAGERELLALPDQAGQEGQAWVRSSSTMLRADGSLPLDIAASGVSMDLDEPWEIEVLLAPGEIGRFGEIFDVDDLPDARASALVRLGGTPASCVLDLTAALEGALGEDEQAVRLDLELAQAEEEVALDVVVSQHMQRQVELRVAGRTRLAEFLRQESSRAFGMPLPPGTSLLAPDDPRTWVDELDASFVPLGVSTEVIGRLVALPSSLEGSVVGGLQLTGDPLHPEISGALQLVSGAIGDVGLAPAYLALTPEDDGYGIDLNLGFDTGGSLLATGFVPLELDLEDPDALRDSLEREDLDVEIGGDGIPLEALVGLVGGVEAVEGTLFLEGGLTGSVLTPEPELRTWMDGGSLILDDLQVRYEDIRLEASVIGELARIERLHLRSLPAYGLATSNLGGEDRLGAAGTLDLEGTVHLEGWSPSQVRLRGRAERFWLIDTNRWRLRATADLRSSGRWPALDLRGDVEVSDARIVLDETTWLYSGTLELDPMIQIHRGATDTARVEVDEGPSWVDALDVELGLDLSRAATVVVEMPFDDTFGALYASLASILIETRVDGLLDVGFEQGELSILGEIEPVVGRADILGARFNLGEGIVSFVGDDPFDPILKLEAVHGNAQYGEVAVDITGSLMDMGLSFRSDDYPDETDIVSILIMGVPASELDEIPASSPVAMAANVLLGEFERQGGGGQVLDTFEGELTDDNKLAMSAGRSFGDDIFVTVSYDGAAETDEGENRTEITLDWTITRSWSAEFVTGDQGTSSGDLYWTWRF